MHDCHTKNGIRLPVSSPEIRDRYLAGDNKLVTKAVADTPRKKGGYVLVRSPMTWRHIKACASCAWATP